jgi:hypothetical protein
MPPTQPPSDPQPARDPSEAGKPPVIPEPQSGSLDSWEKQKSDSVRSSAGVPKRVREAGLRLWFDEWVLKPGDSIPAKIEEGLEPSHFGFRISDFGFAQPGMSANAFGSDWAQLEASTFRFRDPLNQERCFIPLRLDDVFQESFGGVLNPATGQVIQSNSTSANWPARHRPVAPIYSAALLPPNR